MLAAEQYALRLVLPTSQRSHPTRRASLSKLEQAVKLAHSAHANAERAHHEAQQAARRRAEEPTGEAQAEGAEEAVAEEELDELDAEAV